ncbi:MAG: hypothetical protein ACI9ZF_001425 [Bradyrhizobium sp.]|jgi:hypothetical protein
MSYRILAIGNDAASRRAGRRGGHDFKRSLVQPAMIKARTERSALPVPDAGNMNLNPGSYCMVIQCAAYGWRGVSQ